MKDSVLSIRKYTQVLVCLSNSSSQSMRNGTIRFYFFHSFNADAQRLVHESRGSDDATELFSSSLRKHKNLCEEVCIQLGNIVVLAGGERIKLVVAPPHAPCLRVFYSQLRPAVDLWCCRGDGRFGRHVCTTFSQVRRIQSFIWGPMTLLELSL